jgi:hypothetical protein
MRVPVLSLSALICVAALMVAVPKPASAEPKVLPVAQGQTASVCIPTASAIPAATACKASTNRIIRRSVSASIFSSVEELPFEHDGGSHE